MQEIQHPIIVEKDSDVRMGVGNTPFAVQLSDEQFSAFLESLPQGSKKYYAEFSPPNEVTVVLPCEYRGSFDLSDPKLTLEEMLAHSKHLNSHTQAVALESLLRAIA